MTADNAIILLWNVITTNCSQNQLLILLCLTLQVNDRQQPLQKCQQITGVFSHYARRQPRLVDFLFSQNWRLVCHFVSLPKTVLWRKGGKCLRLSPPRCDGRVRKRVGTALAATTAGASARAVKVLPSHKSMVYFGSNWVLMIKKSLLRLAIYCNILL